MLSISGHKRLIGLLAVCLLLSFPNGVAAQSRTEVVAYSGESAPGTNGAIFTSLMTAVGISNDGSVLFRAGLSGGGTIPGSNDEGLWLYQDGQATLVTRTGDPVVDMPGYVVKEIRKAYMDLSANVAFEALVATDADNEVPFFTFENGVVVRKVGKGSPVEGGNELLGDPNVIAFNDGRILLAGALRRPPAPSSGDVAIMIYDESIDPAALQFVVREGDPMPGAPAGFIFDFKANNLANPLSASGAAIIQMSGTNPSTQESIGGVFKWIDGTLNPIEVSAVGQTLTVFGQSRLNAGNDGAFLGYLQFPSSFAIWHEGERNDPVAADGDPANGLSSNFSAFQSFALADDGRLVVGALAATGQRGIWKEDADGILRKIAAVGDAAPGLADGFEFYRVNNLSVSTSGRLAFSDLAVSTSSADETSGVWTGDENGLSLIIRRGDSVTLGQGDVRIVQDPDVGVETGAARTGADGHPTAVNEAGDVLFGVAFEGQGYALMVGSSGLVVNSTADLADADDINGDGIMGSGEESDGVCDTGNVITRDDGSEEPECTLRAAITEANAVAGPDRITFDIPGTAPYVIQPNQQLPTITEALSIAGPVAPQTAGKSAAGPGEPLVRLDGSKAPADSKGTAIASSGVKMSNLVVVNWPSHGIQIKSDDDSDVLADIVVNGCYIGTDHDGKEGLANAGYGVQGQGLIIDLTIGGPGDTDGNTISGNQLGGVRLEGEVVRATIQGNFVGAIPSFDNQHLGNGGPGISIAGGSDNTLILNVVSSNDNGIEIQGDGNHLLSNIVGTNVFGQIVGVPGDSLAFSNGSVGIKITGSNNLIGDDTKNGNQVAGQETNVLISGGSGNVMKGNTIGLDHDGERYLNSGMGVYVISDGNTIGSESELGRNTIAFGRGKSGIEVAAAKHNAIVGNLIGFNVMGACPTPGASPCRLNGFGLALVAARGTEVRANMVGHAGGEGIAVVHSDSTTIQKNYVGLDPTGTKAAGNGGRGIRFVGSSYGTIGGPDDAEGNVVSANGQIGIEITGVGSKSNEIEFNRVGVSASGECTQDPCPLGNAGPGIVLDDSTSLNLIRRNQIAGNGSDGIRIRASRINQLVGNLIGTDPTGSLKIPNQGNGVWIEDASFNSIGIATEDVSNVISGNRKSGVLIRGSKSIENTVVNNFLGTDATGSKRLGNEIGGVIISDAPTNRVGGTKPNEPNVISANSVGVGINRVGATENVVEGNLIGTAVDGIADLGNDRYGIIIQDASSNRVGGLVAAGRNVVSGNGGAGVYLTGDGDSLNTIRGNLIGLDAQGSPLGNDGSGVEVDRGAHANEIGGETDLERNYIADNGAAGITISGPTTARNTIDGNYIGTDTTGTTDVGNKKDGILVENAPKTSIGLERGNLVSGNGGDGVYLNGPATSGSHVLNNLIGTDRSGKSRLGNDANGLSIVGARTVLVGEIDGDKGNIISGNVGHGVFLGGSKIIFLSGNYIGTDSTGMVDLGNEMDGVHVVQSGTIAIGGSERSRNLCDGTCNVISGNDQHGISVQGDQSLGVQIAGNFIGTDRTGAGSLPNTGRGISIVGGSLGSVGGNPGQANLIAHHGGLVGQRRNAGVALIGVDDWSITNNDIRQNNAGVLLVNASQSKVAGNRITLNQCGIEQIGTRQDINVLEANFVAQNQGDCTGIRLESGQSHISGNNISGDLGNGITIEGDAQPVVHNNNITGNGGFGIITADEAYPIDARANWWGDASGPGGDGPGLGDEVGSGIDYGDWRSSAVALVTSFSTDTLVVMPGSTDSVQVMFRNWTNPGDMVTATLSDDRDWLKEAQPIQLSLEPEIGASMAVRLEVPDGTAGSFDMVRLAASSSNAAEPAVLDSFFVAVYEPTLTSITVVPDSAVALPGDSLQFEAQGADQFGRSIPADITWSATGGSISEEGLFVTGDVKGEFSVTATSSDGSVTKTARIFVPSSVSVEESGTPAQNGDVPNTFALYQSYPNPFNPTATITFDVASESKVDLRVFDIRGREIADLIDERKQPGRYSVVFDATGLPSGIYLYRINMGSFVEVRRMTLVK